MEKLTSTTHFLIAMAQVADQNNLDTLELLRKAEIDPSLLHAPELRVNTKKLADFVWLVSNAIDDETLGQCAHPNRIGTFFTMGELAVHQPNLLLALKRGIRFHRQVANGYELDFSVGEETASFRIYQPRLDLDPHHLLTDLILLAWHRFFSWLIGDNIVLSSARFAYSPPVHVDEYRFLFPCPRDFSQPYSGFSFHPSYLQKPVIRDAVAVKAFMHECPLKLFMRPESDKSTATRVQKRIQKNLKDGGPSLRQVSKELGMSNRTLRRKLSEEGTSFQSLKDMIRRDVAINYLVQQSLSVGEIAELLGFSEPGVFVRAFKKWAGVTPGAYQRRTRG